jgi:hypothetical protein
LPDQPDRPLCPLCGDYMPPIAFVWDCDDPDPETPAP